MNKLPLTLGVLAVLTGLLAWWPASVGRGGDAAQADRVLGRTDAAGKPVPVEQVAFLAVSEWDEAAAMLKRIEVRKAGEGWSITSHHGYPADAQERASKLAAGFLGAELGREVTADPAKHEELGVLDPQSQDGTRKSGRGKRLVLKDASDGILLDVIVGKVAEKGEGRVYLRDLTPGRTANQVYTVKVDNWLLTTRFTDYVETDPFKISRDDIRGLTVANYAVDAQSGALIMKEPETELRRPADREEWTSPQTPPDRRVAKPAVDSLLLDLTGLRLTGVRAFEADRRDIQQQLLVMSSYGFYPTDQPELLKNPKAVVYDFGRYQFAMFGNEGRTDVLTKDGLRFSFLFGTICADPDFEDPTRKAAESATDAEAAAPAGANRYMAVFVQYVPEADETAQAAADAATAAAAARKPTGKERAARLQERFQRFFYVISDSNFRNLRPGQDKLFEAKPPEPMAGDTGKTIRQWLDENARREGVTTTASGLQYEILASGPEDGPHPGPQDQVEVRYRGTLVDGTEFDSSKDGTATFAVGGVIKGWTEALQLMKPGDRWKLTIPPELGYGETGSGDRIQGAQILIFDVELVGKK